jgi:hypothetical protein
LISGGKNLHRNVVFNGFSLKAIPKMASEGLGDDAIIDLLTATAKHYRQELEMADGDPLQLRMEILRRLELISHSLKGLLKGHQAPLFRA